MNTVSEAMPNSSGAKYWFKQLVEHPSSFIAAVCMLGLFYIYTDFKEMLQSQHKDTMQTVVAIEKLTEEVRVNSVELAHLQHEMAYLRKEREEK